MRTKETAQTVTGSSSAAASTTTVLATSFKGDMLVRANYLAIDALLTGPTGGTLDVYLQRKIAADTWRDWIHFPQMAAGSTKRYSVAITGSGSTIVETGGGSDAAPGVALAANTAVNVIPGGEVRVVCVTGGGVSVAGTVNITITPYSEKS